MRFFLKAVGSFKCFYFMCTRVSKLAKTSTYVFLYLMQVMFAYSCHYYICPINTVKTVDSWITFLYEKGTFFVHKALVLCTYQEQKSSPHLKTSN